MLKFSLMSVFNSFHTFPIYWLMKYCISMEDTKTQKIVISLEEYVSKINCIRDTLKSLEESLMVSRNLEAERWLTYSTLKTKNKIVIDDLRKANKRNKNMLNLFRQSVTDIRLGTEIALPEPLKREVQRTWHQKYDTLLAQNENLRKDVGATNTLLKERQKDIDDLQQKLLTLGERLVERNEAVENICKKYLRLKKRKDEQEILLKGSIESLQDALKKVRIDTTNQSTGMSLTPSKDALLAREMRRSDRLASENSRLRLLLQEARRGYKTSGSSSTISFERPHLHLRSRSAVAVMFPTAGPMFKDILAFIDWLVLHYKENNSAESRLTWCQPASRLLASSTIFQSQCKSNLMQARHIPVTNNLLLIHRRDKSFPSRHDDQRIQV
ncbi:uncharacterized protein LOC143188378 [Calliopsis andreniformis]|uniref:uncharacterized protein LOC143188378 n=1 Tax=Calliopsis andreniformis TaxID=337506 RepID=UPI003FCED87A